MCCVCLDEDTVCAYVCATSKDSQNPHYTCAACYHGLRVHTASHCPMCRHEHVIPAIGRVELSTLGFWTRLVVMGVKSMRWLVEKVMQYYSWSQRYVFTSLIAEYLMEIAYMFMRVAISDDPMAGAVSIRNVSTFLTAQRYAWIGSHFWENWDVYSGIFTTAVTQIDDEDDWYIEQDNPRIQIEPEEDDFPIAIQDEVIKDLIESNTEGGVICLHHRVRQHIRAAEIIGDKWRVANHTTRQMLEIPLKACGPMCKLKFEVEDPVKEYKLLLEQYSVHHKVELRHAYLAYYNNPCEDTRRRVPPVFRHDWMVEQVVNNYANWWEWLSDLWTNYRQFVVYCGAAVSVVAAVVGAYSLATSLAAGTNMISQMGATAGSAERSQRNPRRYVDRSGRQRQVYFHSEVDTPTISEVASRYVFQNSFQLTIKIGEKTKVMYGTGLFGHYLLIPRHYVNEIEKYVMKGGCKLFGCPTTSPQLYSEIIVDWTKVVSSDNTDLAYMQLPPKFPLFKDIRKFMALDTDFDTPITSQGTLMLNPKGSGTPYLTMHDVEISGLENDVTILDQNDNRFQVREAICYDFSKPGVCGSILLRDNHQRPILSMHFAGDPGPNGQGYGILLTQEALKSLCEIKTVPVQFEDREFGSIEQAKFVPI